MKPPVVLSFLWPLMLQSSLSTAYWRTACSVSQTGRVDPILSPGTVSGHVHKFAGGNNVNDNSDFNSLQSSNCSSCEVQADKSAYWTPQLYFSHPNGSVEEVPNYGMTVYYVGRGGDSSNTAPFPAGFKMLTGESRRRAYDNSTLTYLNTRPVADRVSFRCIDEANDIPEQHYMFQTDCTNGLRAQVNFQSCWDGVNLYLDGNAHVDYLSGIDYGECPPSHPIPIPGLFFEVLYMTNSVDQTGGGQFVFSNGDTTGYGFHGDFLNGWDMDVQTDAVQNCLYTDNGGVVSACSSLSPSDDTNFPRDCTEQPSVFDEPVHGLLNALPGCNPITSGPDPAPQVVCPLNSNIPQTSDSTSSTTDTSTPSSSSSVDTAATTSTSDSSQSPYIITVTVSDTIPTSESTSSTATTDSAGASSPFTFSTIAVSTSSNDGVQSPAVASPSIDPTIGGIFVTVSSAISNSTPSGTIVVVSTVSAGDGSLTAISLLTQPPFYPNATVTLTSTLFSTPASAPTTLTAGASFACSLYANFSIQGCPPPTSTTSFSAPPTAVVMTAFVTAVQSVEQVTDTTTSSTIPTTTADTTVFRIRGRQVSLTAR